jgi:hypothetical protein
MTNEPSESPVDTAHAESPLSIRHMMVWAACVAVYLSVIQTIVRFLQVSPSGGVDTAFWAVVGVWQGTGLAGVLLLVVRRFRGTKFPRHGGEMLWIILGIEAVMGLLRYPIHFVQDGGWVSTALFAYGLLGLGVWAAVYLYAILQAETRRWRVVFVLMIATSVAAPALIALLAHVNSPSAIATVFFAARFPQQLAIAISLLVASWIDLRQPQRFPWAHWTGCALYLLQSAATALWLVAILVMGR